MFLVMKPGKQKPGSRRSATAVGTGRKQDWNGLQTGTGTGLQTRTGNWANQDWVGCKPGLELGKPGLKGCKPDRTGL